MRLQLIILLVLTPGLLSQEISQSGTVSVRKGDTLSFNCTSAGSTLEDIVVQLNGQSIQTVEGENIVDAIPIENGAAYTFGPVTERDNGARLNCHFLLQTKDSPEILLNVVFSPNIIPPITNESAIEGTSFTTPLTTTGNPFPVSSNIVITKDGVTIQDGRIAVNIGSGNGASSFTIHNVHHTDSGSYTVNVTTTAGCDTAVINFDVYYIPKFNASSRSKAVNESATFTFNCTPSEFGFPAACMYVFRLNGSTLSNGGNVDITEGVSGSILTVSSLKRSEDSGNYTCVVTNEAGSVTIATHLKVLAPPTIPHIIEFETISPFSATISWSPPSDNGGTDQPLKYSINITNNTVTLSFTTSDVTTLSLTNLQHSTLYTVTIGAENEYGVSPTAASTFTTPDSVPIIESVSVEALLLTILSVDVVLLTDGGQNVTNYNYTVVLIERSLVETISSSRELTIENLMLRIGQKLTITVTVTNIVGESDPFQSNFTVNDMITALPATEGYIPAVVAVVGGVIGTVLVIILTTTFILLIGLYCRHKTRSQGHTKETKEVVYEDVDSKAVDLQPNPSYATVSSPLTSLGLSGQVQGPVYEECEMRDRVVTEENPAYGALTKPTEYSNL